MKNKTIPLFFMVGLTLSLWFIVSAALAQSKPSDNMQLYLDSVKADKKLFVAENLQLTKTEAKAFWPVYEQYQEELFLIRTRTVNLINDYLAAYENITKSVAHKLLEEFITIETLQLKLNKTYLPKFRKAMSDAKVLRYYQIENKTKAALSYELAATIPYIKQGGK
jgi:hypothetical protein